MKKNAVYLAAIAIAAAGCATQGGFAENESGSGTSNAATYHSGAYFETDSEVRGGEVNDRTATGRIDVSEPLDPPTSLEHDSAYEIDNDTKDFSARGDVVLDEDSAIRGDSSEVTAAGGSGQSVSGQDSGHIQADSSVRGGSDRARGFERSANDHELSTDELDSRVQADSSIRGGSNDARAEGEQRLHGENPSEGEIRQERRIKADSSVRGGSDRARGFDQNSQTDATDSSADHSVGVEASGEGALQSSDNTNWSLEETVNAEIDNGSRDSLSAEDGSFSANADIDSDNSLPVDDSNIGDADSSAASETGGTASIRSGEMPGDDVGPDAEDPYHGSTTIDAEASGGFNAVESESGSSESNLSGEADGDANLDQVDAEAATTIQSDTQSDEKPQPQVFPGNDPHYLFNSNPAKGIGAPPAGQTESAAGGFSSGNTDERSSVSQRSNERGDLSSMVKAQLTRESTGTFGVTREDARNVQITAHGGTVTLKGSVANQQQKDLMELRAREVQGVQRVDNQLTVSPNADVHNRNSGAANLGAEVQP